MDNLIRFLRDRLAEDEAAVVSGECRCEDGLPKRPDCADRVLADVVAKRQIIDFRRDPDNTDPKEDRVSKKANKIILSVILGLMVTISVIAMVTGKGVEDDLVEALRAVDPALVTAETVTRARTVCVEGVTVANIMGAFYVDAGVAARMTVPIAAYCKG